MSTTKETIVLGLTSVGLALVVLLVTTEARGETVAQRYQRSYKLEAAKRYGEAINAVKKLPAAQRSSYFAQLRLAWLSYLAKQHHQAIRAYRAAIRKKRRAVEPLLGLTLVQMTTRKWKDALQSASKALRLAPGNDTANTRRAWILFNLGRYAESERAYRKVLRHYPANLELQRGLAWALLKQGKTTQARKAFERVLQHAPTNRSAAQGLRLVKAGRKGVGPS